MGRGRTPLLLLAACLAVFAYIWFVERGRDPEQGDKKPNVFAALDAEAIEEIVLTNSTGTQTTLRKAAGTWSITAPLAAATDAAEVSGLTTNLATLAEQRVVDEAPADLAPFGLLPPRVQIAFRTSGSQATRTLLLGAKTATGGDLYAKTGDSPRVFLVSAFLDTTFDRSTFDLRDKTVALFDRASVDRVELARGADRVVIAKSASGWSLTEPYAVRADNGTVESFIGRINSATMKSIDAEPATDLAPFGLDTPELTVTLGLGSTTASFLLGKRASDGSVYARDGARSIVFTVDATLADDLRKTADDFRPRDLFEFRPFTASRIELTREAATTVFAKVKGTEPNAVARWAQAQPAKDVPADTIGDALSSLSNLRAEAFIPVVPAGATTLVAITATFGEGKTETVHLLKAGAEYVATRRGDAGAMKVAATDAEGIMKTLDGLK